MAFYNLHNEKILLQQMAEGNEASFADIYEAYHDYLYRFVIKFVKSPELAEDLTQEIFMHVWELRKEFVKLDSFKAYLFVAGRNHTLNFLKKASRENSAKAEILRHYQSVPSNADENLLSSEYRKFIKDVLDSLPAQTRIIFKMCREEHKSYDEVAELLGISRNAVKKHMVRSHKTFKDKLGHKPEIPLGILLLLFFKA